MNQQNFEYVGFWIRVLAALADTLALVVVLTPFIIISYLSTGGDIMESLLFSGLGGFIFSDLLPAVIVILLWMKLRATPGKMLFGAVVVDAETGAPITALQGILRYVGYFISSIPFCLGLIWVAFDDRKQGWHDKIAKTVVIRAKS